MNSRTKLVGTIAVGAALLVPVAHAQSPDDRAGLRGPGAIAAQQVGNSAGHPDNRDVRGAAVAIVSTPTAGASLHPDNNARRRGPATVGRAVIVSRSSGFDWGDAMVGSVGGVGAALLLTGGFFLLASQRNKARAA